jgi:undecaprenyl-diphosphatase
MDRAWTVAINALAGHNAALDFVMAGTTRYGVPIIVALVLLQWWSRRDRSHMRHTALAAGLSFLGGLAINQAILLFVHRVRPYDAGMTHLIVPPSTDWSFPSDHTTAVVSVAAAFAFQRLPGRTLGLFAAALLMAFSRVYVGSHYVSDVIGGACTGALAAVAVRAGFREGSRLDRALTAIL